MSCNASHCATWGGLWGPRHWTWAAAGLDDRLWAVRSPEPTETWGDSFSGVFGVACGPIKDRSTSGWCCDIMKALSHTRSLFLTVCVCASLSPSLTSSPHSAERSQTQSSRASGAISVEPGGCWWARWMQKQKKNSSGIRGVRECGGLKWRGEERLPPSPCFRSASFPFVMDLWSKRVLGINAHVTLILFSLCATAKAGE